MSKTIQLTRGYETIVSEEDFHNLNQFKWHVIASGTNGKFYVCRKKIVAGQRFTIRMHREILGLPWRYQNGIVVNHINNDSLDNRRENLEVVTQLENMNKVSNWKKKGVK